MCTCVCVLNVLLKQSSDIGPFPGTWPSKSNLLGQIHYTISMGKPAIVYKIAPTLINGRPIRSNPCFKL